MKNEEAILYLEDMKIKFEIPKAAVQARLNNEALDMAIKALEQPEPCEDTISRQAAIYIASGYCHPANIAKELAKLPSVQPKIIRCKDCLMHGVCRFEQGLGLDGYCSQAKRRTDG